MVKQPFYIRRKNFFKNIRRIIITPGEPAGIGPDIAIQIAQQEWDAEILVLASPELLAERATQLHLPLQLLETNWQAPREKHVKGELKIIPIPLQTTVKTGELNAANASYVINTLNQAADACKKNNADALVTGPVHKGILNQAGFAFSGHTEFFAQLCQVKNTVMLFVISNEQHHQLRVALCTTHLPLKEVAGAITSEKLPATLNILISDLKKYFKLSAPKIYVCGLNPHAGENGHLGKEEIEILTPILESFRKQGNEVIGPLSADTIFTAKYLNQADAILAMYHDQALPIVKYIGFGHAVNMTLGLPFIRTSVDHGTALDMAGSGKADPGSLQAAIQLAHQLIVQMDDTE